MDQPLINQDTNAKDQSIQVVQGNIISTDNQNSNQAQIPSNPNYMMPPNMNPPQEQQPPQQPYYPPQNQNNQIPLSSQPYYAPPQNAVPNQLQPQPYYPPGQAQGMAVSPPQISTQPVYNQQVIPPNHCPDKPGILPIQYSQPVIKDYKNCNNISQIPHKRVFQPEPNIFYISNGCCTKCIPYFFTLLGAYFLLMASLFGKNSFGIYAVLGFFFLLFGLLSCCNMIHKIYFIMDQNNLTVIKKAIAGKKTRVYNRGELQRVEFNSFYTISQSRFGSFMYNYSVVIVLTNGNAEPIFSTSSSSALFTIDEINYFLYSINTHIQTKMRV